MENWILLHGALGNQHDFNQIKEALSEKVNVYTFNFEGHDFGFEEKTFPTFSIENFAENLRHFINRHQLQKVHLFGYSMGGYVALYSSAKYDIPIVSVTTLGTKFNWDESFTAKQLQFLKPDILENKAPAFAMQLKHKFGENYWHNVVEQTASMMQKLGNDNLLKPIASIIDAPVTLLLGENDIMVTLEETQEISASISKSKIAVLPKTPHAIEQVDVQLLLPYFLNN